MKRTESKGCFWRIATAGIFFQGGAAAVDPATIMAALVNILTGSPAAVGAAAAISRYGWLFPQAFVGYFAQRARRRMPFYMLGAFGRVACLAAVAAIVLTVGPSPSIAAIAAFFALWTLYAFVSGIVAVPYNDIVARQIPSGARSRLLALRFFGGGIVALAVAATAHLLIGASGFPGGYAAVLLLGAGLLLASSLFFVSAGEPVPPARSDPPGFGRYLKAGLSVYSDDSRFRLFVHSRWLDGAVTMALPFYVIEAMGRGIGARDVASLLAAQTVGALISNPVWGWWGDRIGKRNLLEAVAVLAILSPALMILAVTTGDAATVFGPLPWFAIVFLVLGAAGNGRTIAQLGYLMEISPDDQRPAYSGYFNAFVAPAALSPILGAAIFEAASASALFAVSASAAILQVFVVHRLRHANPRRERS